MNLCSISDLSSSSSQPTSTGATGKRTRCRFSGTQISLLEELYHANTHPSREERESVAVLGDMELRSVTIWFQNKRQMDRRCKPADMSKTHSSSTTGTLRPNGRFNRTLSAPATSLSDNTHPARGPLRKAMSLSTLSLDVYASRAEQPMPKTPPRAERSFTRCKTTAANAPLWDLMPPTPSPPKESHFCTQDAPSLDTLPHSSPEVARTFVEFGRRTGCTTLEWACAAARLAPGAGADREKGLTPPQRPLQRARAGSDASGSSRWLPDMHEEDEGELPVPMEVDGAETEDEAHEAVTPSCSLTGNDPGWESCPSRDPTTMVDVGDVIKTPKGAHDEETMRAALVLCGLNRS